MAAKQPSKISRKERASNDLATSVIIEAAREYQATIHVDALPTDLLNLNTSQNISLQDIVISELQAARLLNIDMPNEPTQFLRILEARIKEITGTRKNVILLLDEESGTYTCLNDELYDDLKHSPRELTWISDNYLKDLLGSDQVIHSFLHQQGSIFGIVAIADKLDGTVFSTRDEIILEQLTQYLSVQVNHFLTLKRSMVLPTIQQTLLKISSRLLSAVDSAAIFKDAMGELTTEMPFNAAQYIHLNRDSGKGAILFQLAQGQFTQGAPIQEVDQFSSMLSLFQSQVWHHPYLYLKGEMLGDKSFSELFGLPNIVSVLILPMVSEDSYLDGALVLFQQEKAVTLSKESLHVIEHVSELIISACGRAKILEKALEIATTDELTGAVNRRGFYTRFDAEIDRARRNQTPISFAMIDLDHFKMINDTYGHLVGDQILRELSSRIHKNIRKSDLLCRYGGEEFALMLPETALGAAKDLVERLRHKVEKAPFNTSAGPIKITFSAGLMQVATHQDFTKDPMAVISDAIGKADTALYEAKQLGRNRLVVTD